MKFTEEQLKKINTAKNAEELLALAKAEGVALTEEEAAKFFADLNKEGELADEELDNVAGGCGGGTPDPKYHAGQKVCFRTPDGEDLYGIIESSNYVELQGAWYYLVWFGNGDEMKFPLESEYCPAKVID